VTWEKEFIFLQQTYYTLNPFIYSVVSFMNELPFQNINFLPILDWLFEIRQLQYNSTHTYSISKFHSSSQPILRLSCNCWMEVCFRVSLRQHNLYVIIDCVVLGNKDGHTGMKVPSPLLRQYVL
jgi:hypothetical protein